MSERSAVHEWRSGWPLVLMTLVGITGSISQTYMLGMFIGPLQAEFGWSRAQISSPMLFFSVATLLLASAGGALIDRVGPRRVALIGVPIAGLALAAVGFSGPSIWTWYLAWAVFAPFALALGPLTWSPAISRHFNVSRGLALALGYCGSGIGAALWPPLTLYLIDAHGWRGAFFAVGAAIVLIVTPCIFLLFRGPATGPRAQMATAAERLPPGLSLAQALRSSMFWRIALVLMVTAAAVSSISVHLPALLTDHGLSRLQAASVAALIGPSLLVGRITGGALLDRVPARWVASVFLLLPAIACFTLVGYDGSYAHAVAAAVLIGLTAGVEGDLLAYLLSRYFGMRSFGAIYGAGLAIFGIGYGMAPTVGGALFDKLGSYDIGLGVLSALLVVCALVSLTYGRYPHFEETKEGAP